MVIRSVFQKNMFHGYGHTEQVDDVAFHPSDTNMLASASADHTVRLWDVRQTRTHTRLLTKGLKNWKEKFGCLISVMSRVELAVS